jgi:hypothetical protein
MANIKQNKQEINETSRSQSIHGWWRKTGSRKDKQKEEKELDRSEKSGLLKLNNETVDFVVLSTFTELQIQQLQTSDNNAKKNNAINVTKQLHLNEIFLCVRVVSLLNIQQLDIWSLLVIK